jgi:hypothetical protein
MAVLMDYPTYINVLDELTWLSGTIKRMARTDSFCAPDLIKQVNGIAKTVMSAQDTDTCDYVEVVNNGVRKQYGKEVSGYVNRAAG